MENATGVGGHLRETEKQNELVKLSFILFLLHFHYLVKNKEHAIFNYAFIRNVIDHGSISKLLFEQKVFSLFLLGDELLSLLHLTHKVREHFL